MAGAELMPSLKTPTNLVDDQSYAETRNTGVIDGSYHLGYEGRKVDLPIISRHLLTIACLVGTEAQLELEWHIRKALRDGCPVSEIKQVLSLLTIYCDTPAAVSVLKNAEKVVDMWIDKRRQD